MGPDCLEAHVSRLPAPHRDALQRMAGDPKVSGFPHQNVPRMSTRHDHPGAHVDRPISWATPRRALPPCRHRSTAHRARPAWSRPCCLENFVADNRQGRGPLRSEAGRDDLHLGVGQCLGIGLHDGVIACGIPVIMQLLGKIFGVYAGQTGKTRSCIARPIHAVAPLPLPLSMIVLPRYISAALADTASKPKHNPAIRIGVAIGNMARKFNFEDLR